MTEINLDLDVDRGSNEGGAEPIARVCVVLACGYVRGGGATTITADCSSYEELEREVDRLRDELDSVLERARRQFDGTSETPAATRDPRLEQGAAAEGAEPVAKSRVGGDLHVRDLMTRDVKTLPRNDKLSVADELMNVGRFRHVVVLDDAGGVAGIVSQRDIFYGALAWSMGLGQFAHQKALESFPVKDVMETHVESVHPDTPLGEAAQKMMERKIGCLPVIDGNRLVGILTDGDFLAMIAGA